MEIARGARPEQLAPTAINFLWNNYTPPMARFLGEISRATAPQVTWFDRGAARTLPFTPALTYRHTILTAARWKVRSRALPAHTATLQEWADQLHAWRARLRVPERVLLAEDDQQLPLDRAKDVHLNLLRAHLEPALSASRPCTTHPRRERTGGSAAGPTASSFPRRPAHDHHDRSPYAGLVRGSPGDGAAGHRAR
ncbi:lantibiotic dehydratase [Streptomyces mirabilis]